MYVKSGQGHMNLINVYIQRPSENTIVLASNYGDIRIEHSGPADEISSNGDFAVWFFLPLAMRLGFDIEIDATGTPKTCDNAFFVSSIWQRWLPGHFSATRVKFKRGPAECCLEDQSEMLSFYSGGIDSTFSLLSTYIKRGVVGDLLTVHGMDYKFDDPVRFEALIAKTSPFATMVSKKRLFVRTDAYALYNRYHCNPDGHHVTHIFSLAGSAFLHSRYGIYSIAADYRLDQQFLVHPWGSNSATNKYISDGKRSIITTNDDISRSDKLELLTKSSEALSSLTFCVNYKSRPNNCGVCSKCIRTKIMFLARTGSIPNIFNDLDIPSNWYSLMNISRSADRVFLADIISCIERFNSMARIPNFDKAKRAYEAYVPNETNSIGTILRKKIRQSMAQVLDVLKR